MDPGACEAQKDLRKHRAFGETGPSQCGRALSDGGVFCAGLEEGLTISSNRLGFSFRTENMFIHSQGHGVHNSQRVDTTQVPVS